MDINITEAFRQEDISKTDFFDFVVSPDLTESQLQLAKQMRSVNVFLEQDVQSPPETSTSSKEQNNNLLSSDDTPPLAGYDQFWSADNKDSTRLESAILEDLSRYCWNQPQDSLPSLGGSSNTDGQIYTLTVLNGTAAEPWTTGRKEETPAPLDLESILGGLPGFAVKTESFSYEDSGFADNKDDINEFQNNNNDWRLADHNSSADSLLRSALQGKGYGKPKPDEELRRALTTPSETVLFPIMPVTTDQDSLGFVDANLPLFEEEHQATPVDDMFLSQLDVVSYPEDYEKLKRIATEVQQFCTETYTPVEVTSSVVKPAVKKYRKSNAGGKPANSATTGIAASTCTGGARKERSLHYCSICSKGFKDKYSVNVHIRTHTGEKPFACSLCGKSFRQKAHLAKHYQTHLAQKNAAAGNVAKPSKR